MILEKIPLNRILFLDIETVPLFRNWNDADEMTQKLWAKKTERLRGDEYSAEELYEDRAAIWAEFGKIVCISCGLIINNEARIKSYTGEEVDILNEFNRLLSDSYFSNDAILCAHNGKEFDFPYLSRRMVINQIPMPTELQNFGKKPWEINHLDTLDLWKFGDYKHYTSLELLAFILGIPTPKQEMNGADVARVFYQDNDLEKIIKYCEGDVLTLINVFLKMRFEPQIKRA